MPIDAVDTKLILTIRISNKVGFSFPVVLHVQLVKFRITMLEILHEYMKKTFHYFKSQLKGMNEFFPLVNVLIVEAVLQMFQLWEGCRLPWNCFYFHGIASISMGI